MDATVSKPNDSINPKHRVGTMKLSSTTPRSIRARIAKGEAAAKMRRAHSANAAETKANNATPSSNNEVCLLLDMLLPTPHHHSSIITVCMRSSAARCISRFQP